MSDRLTNTRSKWTDSTSYSRGGERIQTAWTLKLMPGFDVYVTCGHIHYRPQFVMGCGALGIDTRPLDKGITPEQAQSLALAVVADKLGRMCDALAAHTETP